MNKKLSDVLRGITKIKTTEDGMISGLCLDSRELKSGDAFFACTGYNMDGNDFIAEALANNAAVILTDKEDLDASQFVSDKPIIFIQDLKQQLSAIASNFYDHPSKKMQVIGITGTNGKTSFCHFLAQALTDMGETVGILGTLGNGIYGKHNQAKLTTPDPVRLQALLADMHAQGAKYALMEASSHGIAQGRINAIEFDTAVFTNLSRDHLDYHGDMLAYGKAKRKLFETKSVKHLVLNIDDDFGCQLLEDFRDMTTIYAFSANGARSNYEEIPTVRAQNAHLNMKGVTASLHTPWGDGLLHSNLLGDFNLSNLLAVLTVLGIHGYRIEDIICSLAKTKGVAGRMQLFGGGNKPYVVVDFAHTPDALKQTLQTLRNYTEGELWCVFGCGGNRDQGKRGQMGQIAENNADNIVLTDDNPRHEEASAIVADILQSMQEPERVVVEHDRHRAIAHAIRCAKANDVILIAGKGHESYQIYGDEQLPFSDDIEVQMLLAEGK